MSAIEKDRGEKNEQQENQEAIKEIFATAIELLQAKGEENRGFLFLRYKAVQYTDKSREPEVEIEIKAGNDLRKASKVKFSIGGQQTFYFEKGGAKGREVFFAEKKLNRPGGIIHFGSASGTEIRSYQADIKRVVSQVMPK